METRVIKSIRILFTEIWVYKKENALNFDRNFLIDELMTNYYPDLTLERFLYWQIYLHKSGKVERSQSIYRI